MKLQDFRITHYRSINDSGTIPAAEQTVLVGRNESGKTSLLLALAGLNPAAGLQPFSLLKDFPRDRAHQAFNEELRVVQTTWQLSTQEKATLADLFPRAKGIEFITIGRTYKPTRFVGFKDLPPLLIDSTLVNTQCRRLEQALILQWQNRDPAVILTCTQALERLKTQMKNTGLTPAKWGEQAGLALAEFLSVLAACKIAMSADIDGYIQALEIHAEHLKQDAKAHERALLWIIEQLPLFIYLDEFPHLEGNQNLPEFVHRTQHNRQTASDKNFARLMQAAGLDPLELSRLGSHQHEQRQQMLNRAGATITRKLRELWTDRQLKIRFSLDGDYFATLISDTATTYDVEVNLNERSRGFKWFFSFYITFSAEQQQKSAQSCILLLDEPGLHLHALTQADLLKHFKRLASQVIYTTHSPFMIPATALETVRTVNITEQAGSVVSHQLEGDQRTLYPLQAALSYHLAQQLFSGKRYLIVPDLADYWYLQAIFSRFILPSFSNNNMIQFDLIPAGGMHQVAQLVALLSTQAVDWRVLVDYAPRSLPNTIALNQMSAEFAQHGANIEDLLGAATYHELVKQTYRTALKNRLPALDKTIPRVVAQWQAAFAKRTLNFQRDEPARFFIQQAVTAPDWCLTESSLRHFKTLWNLIQQQFIIHNDTIKPPEFS